MRKPPCVSALCFVKHHLGKSALAPHTGQDFAALNAFAHLCELYAVADTKGREECLKAMSATLACAQRSTWDTFAKCIPHSLDWSDEARIWALIVPRPTSVNHDPEALRLNELNRSGLQPAELAAAMGFAAPPIAQMSSVPDPSRCRSTHPDNASVLCSDDAGHAGDHSYRGRSWK